MNASVYKNYAVLKIELDVDALTKGHNQLALSIQSRVNITDTEGKSVLSVYIDVNYINRSNSKTIFHTVTMTQFDVDASYSAEAVNSGVDDESMRIAFSKAVECSSQIARQANVDLPDLPSFEEVYKEHTED